MTWKERKKLEDQNVVSLGGKVKLLLVMMDYYIQISYKNENIISAVYVSLEYFLVHRLLRIKNGT